jgi:hypothetical protein
VTQNPKQLGVSRYIHATFRPKQRLPSGPSQARLNQHHCFSARDKKPFFPRVRPEISRFPDVGASRPATAPLEMHRCSRSTTNHRERRQTSLVRKSNPTTDGKLSYRVWLSDGPRAAPADPDPLGCKSWPLISGEGEGEGVRSGRVRDELYR